MPSKSSASSRFQSAIPLSNMSEAASPELAGACRNSNIQGLITRVLVVAAVCASRKQPRFAGLPGKAERDDRAKSEREIVASDGVSRTGLSKEAGGDERRDAAA